MSVNGVTVHNLKHMQSLISDATNETVRIDLDEDRVIVLNREEAEVAGAKILQMYRIPAAMSQDLVDGLE